MKTLSILMNDLVASIKRSPAYRDDYEDELMVEAMWFDDFIRRLECSHEDTNITK